MATPGTQPTVEQRMAEFNSFETKDGEVTGAAVGLPKDTDTESAADNKNKASSTPENETGLQHEAAESEESSPDKELDKAAIKTPQRGNKVPYQERINELTRTRHEAERALAAERAQTARRLLEMEARIALLAKGDLTGAGVGAIPDANSMPDPNKFAYGELDSGYIRALARYEAKQEMASAQKAFGEQQERGRQETAQREVQAKLQTFEEAGVGKYDDFYDTVVEGARNGDWKLSDELGRLILGSENGPDIAYHLASNPKEARQVFGKSPLEQAAYFGRMEAQFSSSSPDATGQKPKAGITKAPAPPASVARGAGSGTGSGNADTVDFAAFEALVRRRK